MNARRSRSAGDVPPTKSRSRPSGEDFGVEQLLEGEGPERRLLDEELSVASASVGNARVAGRVDDDVAAPAPRAARVLEHREQQQVLEPHHGELRSSLDRLDRAACEDAGPLGDLDVAPQVARLGGLGLHPLVVLDGDAYDPVRPVSEVEHEGGIEGAQAVQVRGVEAAWRVCEADVTDGAGRLRPPGMDSTVGKRAIRGQVAEEVEGERRRPQEVGPQSLMVEALVSFGHGRSGSRRLEGSSGEKGGAGLTGVGEREAASDGSSRLAVQPRCDRLEADGMTVCLTPKRLFVAQPSPEGGQVGLSGNSIVGFPAMHRLELLPRRLTHRGDRTARSVCSVAAWASASSRYAS